MAYQRRTKDEYQLVYDYGYGDGLEVIYTAVTLDEAKSVKSDYIKNTEIYPAIVKKRVPIEQRGVIG